MPNIEIKAHCPDLANATEIAKHVATKHLGMDHQIDTYFRTPNGRLKLRESSLSGAMLIPYIRSNISGPKKSDYALLRTDDPALSKRLLSEILGIETIVEKHRDIYLAGNVRIHLDNVKGLGTFMEFEAVYQNMDDESTEHKKVHELIKTFGLQEADLIQGSYRELSTATTTS